VARQILQIMQPTPPLPPPERGRLMTAEQVADAIFQGTVKAQWVRRNVRPKVVLGHSTVMFYEVDVRRWIELRRSEEAA
jgi:hypothetical protein